MIISASIDLAKIDRSKIVVGKNGAQYYNIQINVNDEADQYGNNASVVTNQTKEEREAKAPKTYLGNGKTVWSSEGAPASIQPAALKFENDYFPSKVQKISAPVQSNDSDLPF